MPAASLPRVVPMDPVLARKLNLVSTICFIGLGGLPHERVVFEEKKDEGGGGGGGGGGGDPPKKLELTQPELDRMVEDRLKKSKAEASETKAKLDELTKSLAELQAKNEELELKGKSADEKARIAAEKAAQKIEAEKAAALKEAADAKAIAEAATKGLRAHIVGAQLSKALIDAKALPTAVHHAAQLFLSDVEIDTDDAHAITAVRLGGVAQKDLATAATEWLKTNSHFAQHTGGGGTKGGAGGNTHGGRPLHELSPTELLAIDAARQTGR